MATVKVNKQQTGLKDPLNILRNITMNCSRFCSENHFVSQLNRFRIAKGSHARSEDVVESLITCISEIRPEADVRRIFTALVGESNPGDNTLSTEADSLMHAGSEFEYGRHRSMYFFNSKSVLGLFMAISNMLNIKLFVICGRLPLKKLRQNDEVLMFHNGSEDSVKLVVGLVGLNICHRLKQPEADSVIWDSLENYSKAINYDILDSIAQNQVEAVVRGNHGLENEEPGSEEVNVASDSVNPINEDTEALTIDSFIALNSEIIDGHKLKVQSSAYTCRDRIDFVETSREHFRTNPISELNYLVDIDGVFGIHNWTNQRVFHGDVNFGKIPSFECKREESNFKRLFVRSYNVALDDIIFFKIGTVSANRGVIYDVFFAGKFERTYENVDFKFIQSKVTEAYQFAIDALCFDVHTGTNLHPGCESKVYRSVNNAHSSNVKSSRITLSNDRYKCFCYHFSKKLTTLLREEDLNITESYQFVQTVGTKSKFFSKSVNGISCCLDEVRTIVNVDAIHCYYDVAFSVYAVANDPTSKVSINYFNFIYFCNRYFFFGKVMHWMALKDTSENLMFIRCYSLTQLLTCIVQKLMDL